MHWIKEVEIAKSINELVTSQSMTGRKDFPDHEMPDAKIASALKRLLAKHIHLENTFCDTLHEPILKLWDTRCTSLPAACKIVLDVRSQERATSITPTGTPHRLATVRQEHLLQRCSRRWRSLDRGCPIAVTKHGMPAKGHVPQECRHAFCRIQNNHADVSKALELQAAKCFLCCAGPNLMAHEHRRVAPLCFGRAFSTLQLRYSSTICDAEWLAVHSDTGFVSSVVTFSAMSSIGRVALRTIEASSSKSFGPKPLGSTCLSAFHGPLASEKRLRLLRVDHDARGV